MTPQLKALLVFLGVLGTGLSVYMVVSSTTKQDLTAAVQAGACPNRLMVDVACSVYWDGGYRDIEIRAARCDDVDGGRFFVVPSFAKALVDGGVSPVLQDMLLMSTCRRIGAGCTLCDGGGVGAGLDPDQVQTTQPLCACLKLDAGPADCLKSDGGSWWDAGTGGTRWNNVIQPGEWSGAGCQPRPCVEYAGLSGQTGCWP